MVYKVDGSLIDKYNYSRKHLRFRPDGKVISFLAPNINSVGRDKAKKYLSSIKEIERVCDIEIKKTKYK